MTDIEKDAMRYRWLRDTNLMPFRNPLAEGGEIGAIDALFICEQAGPYGSVSALAPDDFDAAIDAEMFKRLNQEKMLKLAYIEEKMAENLSLFETDPELSFANHLKLMNEQNGVLKEMKDMKIYAAQAHTQSA